MAIDDPSSVDGLGISRADGKAILTIVDHLDWVSEPDHLRMIERKLGNYLGFIRSGQIYDALAESLYRHVRIELIHQFLPDDEGTRFLEAAKRQLSEIGVEFTYYALPGGY
ncbi:DUF6572 domain-containing protein [Luteibacter aegosomatissinici]|uniref:DUF6572 domain-containing protein n=1 Tax=Luteibacter aegosomatissinici TaxID=2911539 RepID=UPI001FF8B408|nr:DUF6572 domain-containing protein [Luteibacter aegosomatissinici]UPG94310.1 hypothetical protein L2Y97_21255 [Luteibacter aegosomatissinici]